MNLQMLNAQDYETCRLNLIGHVQQSKPGTFVSRVSRISGADPGAGSRFRVYR